MHVFVFIDYFIYIPDGGFLEFGHVEVEVNPKSLEEDSY